MSGFIPKVAAIIAVGAGTTLMLISAAARAAAVASEHIPPAMSFVGFVIGLLAFACGLASLEKKQ